MKRSRLVTGLGCSLGLVLVLNAAFILLVSLRADPSDWRETAQSHISDEKILLSGVFFAIRNGRYPTPVESEALPGREPIVGILLGWLLASLLLFLAWKIGRYLWRRQSRWLKLGEAGLLGIMVILWLLLPALPPPSAAQIHVDTTVSLGPLPEHQRGFSQGGEAKMQTPEYFTSALNRLGPLQPRFIRIDHVFDYYHVYQRDALGQVRYNWVELDRIVDAIRAVGAQPLMCLSYLPPELARDDNIYGPPAHWKPWEELVYQTVYHFNVERRLGIVYWEVWNEPNLGFWNGTLNEYLRLYEATARGARRADPSVRVGGPATASLPPDQRLVLLFYEQNWVTALGRYARDHALPLDFLSWHLYDPQPDDYIKSVRIHQQWLAGSGLTPQLWLTEWNRSGAPSPSLDTEETAAYAAAVLTRLSDTPLTQALFFEPIDSSTQWTGQWGLMRADRVLKPVFNTFRLASELSGERLAVQSNHPQVGALAVRNGTGLSLLIWHLYSGQSSLPVTLTITGLPSGAVFQALVHGVDASHGNPYRQTDAEELLMETLTGQVSNNGEWTLKFSMPDNGVRLVTLQLPN